MLSQQVAEKGTVSHPFFFHGVFLLTKNKQPPFLLHCTSGVGSSSSSPSPCALPYQNSAVSMSLHSLGEPMTESHTPGPLIHSTPPLVPTGPCAASTSMARIPRFGRQHSVGAQCIGAPPIYRPMARRCAPQADKSAMCTKH